MMSQNNDNAKKEARLLLEIVMKTYLSAFQYISCRRFIWDNLTFSFFLLRRAVLNIKIGNYTLCVSVSKKVQKEYQLLQFIFKGMLQLCVFH